MKPRSVVIMFFSGVLGLVVLLALAQPAAAQERPLAPIAPRGLPVIPFFEGWHPNADGTYTLMFGYFNRDYDGEIDIPLGPDNFIDPVEFDGRQPSHFPSSWNRGAIARNTFSVFGIVVPGHYGVNDDVVWTLRSRGEELSVPGRVGVPAYQLPDPDVPVSMGSLPPFVRLSEGGRHISGPFAEMADPLTVSVETPIELTVWATDDGSHREGGTKVAPGIAWTKYQGPGNITFSDVETTEAGEIADLLATTTATFDQVGEYLLRVQVHNFGAPDSSPPDYCCWTNVLVPVTVTP